ncbi:MAG TPA: phosphotransferase [Herpetosiphonaceae bacterium]
MVDAAFSDTLIGSVLAEFGVATFDGARRLDSASPNASFWITAGDQHYLLRCCRRDPRLERLRCLSDVQQTLSRLGVPVPRSYAARSGELIVGRAGLLWQCDEFIAGESYDYANLRHTVEAARCLGAIHACAGQIRPASYCGYDQSIELWWKAPERLLDATWRIAAGCAERADLWRDAWSRFAAFAGLVREWLPWSVYTTLPTLWTHGDFHGLNMKYRGDRLVAIFDFEFADLRPRAYDVAFALLMLARQGRGGYVLRPDRIRCFMQRYQATTAPLAPAERQSIPAMMLISQLPDYGYLMTLARHKGAAEVDRAVQYWLSVLSAIEAQREMLPGCLDVG